MSIFSDWKDEAEKNNASKEQQEAYWREYLLAEQKMYQTILGEKKTVIEGSIEELANQFDVSMGWILGFLDGVSESVAEPLPDLDSLEKDSTVKVVLDYEKLLFNMHKSEADWLYDLEEWNPIFSQEKQDEIAKAYKKSKTVVKENKVGRNEPCPCGSGKKYKKCCGR